MDTAKLGTESVAVQNRAVLGEAPVWDARTQNLVWVDIIGESVHFFDPAANKDRAVAVGEPVGSVAPRKGGGMVDARHAPDDGLESLIIACAGIRDCSNKFYE